MGLAADGHRGLIAHGVIDGEIALIPDPDPLWVDPERGIAVERRIPVRWQRLHRPVWLEDAPGVLGALKASRTQGLSIVVEDPDAWEAAARLAEVPLAASRRGAPRGAGASVTYPPVEEHLTARAMFNQEAKEREALRLEGGLIERFVRHLMETGHEATGVVIDLDGEVIRADLFDRTANVLYEAKAAADRQMIRMAIGQLLDYRRFISPEPRLRVLVPTKPSSDVTRLLSSAGIGVTWPHDEFWCDVEAPPVE